MRLPPLTAKRLGPLVDSMLDRYFYGCIGLIPTDHLQGFGEVVTSPSTSMVDTCRRNLVCIRDAREGFEDGVRLVRGVPAFRILCDRELDALAMARASELHAQYMLLVGSLSPALRGGGTVDGVILLRSPEVLARFRHPSP